MRMLPKAPKRLFLEMGMLGPRFLEKMGPENIESIKKLSEIGPYPRKWADDEWRRN